MFAGKPGARAAKAGVNFVQHQQGLVRIAQRAQLRQEIERRQVDAAAGLDGFHEHGPDFFPAENPAQAGLGPGPAGAVADFWKGREMAEFSQLRHKRLAEMRAVRGVERAVAEPMIPAFKGNDPRFARGEQGRLEGGFHRLEPRIGKNSLAG